MDFPADSNTAAAEHDTLHAKDRAKSILQPLAEQMAKTMLAVERNKQMVQESRQWLAKFRAHNACDPDPQEANETEIDMHKITEDPIPTPTAHALCYILKILIRECEATIRNFDTTYRASLQRTLTSHLRRATILHTTSFLREHMRALEVCVLDTTFTKTTALNEVMLGVVSGKLDGMEDVLRELGEVWEEGEGDVELEEVKKGYEEGRLGLERVLEGLRGCLRSLEGREE